MTSAINAQKKLESNLPIELDYQLNSIILHRGMNDYMF